MHKEKIIKFTIFAFGFFLLSFLNLHKANANGEVIVHMSDTHVHSDEHDRNMQRFKALVNDINEVIKPQLVVHSGDIADFADSLEVYNLFFREWEKINAPKIYVSGNHDYIKSNWTGSFVFHNSQYNQRQSEEVGNFKFIGIPYNNYNLELNPEGWVDRKASEASQNGKTPIFVMHYPVTKPNISPWSEMDSYKYLLYPNYLQQMQNLIYKYKSPIYLSGHIHTAYKVRERVNGWTFEQLVAGFPPGGSNFYSNYALLVIDKNKIYTSHQKINKWPAITITSPDWYDPQSNTGEIDTTPLVIRAKIIGRSENLNAYNVTYNLNNQNEGTLAYDSNEKIFKSQPIDITPYRNQIIQLTINAKDTQHTLYDEDETYENQQTISVKIAQNLTNEPPEEPAPPEPSPPPPAPPNPEPVTREINLKISSPNDDNFQLYGERNGNYQIINLGYVYQAMFRFTNVPIPKEAQITKAYLKVAPTWYQSKTGIIPIWGENNPQSLPADQQNISSRRLTNAHISWKINSDWPSRKYQQSPNIANIIQEIVNNRNWNEQSTITLITKENYAINPGQGNYWSVYSYENNQELAAKLYIQYNPPQNTPPSPPPPSEKQTYTVEISVIKPNNDHYQIYYANGGWGNTGIDDRILIGKRTSFSQYKAALLFTNPNIPKGAQIKSANLKLAARWWQNKEGTIKMAVQDPSDPSIETPPDQMQIGERKKLSRWVFWPISGAWRTLSYKESPNLKDLLQEFIDSPGYTNQSNIVIILEGDTNNSYWTIASFEYSRENTAKLTITYEY